MIKVRRLDHVQICVPVGQEAKAREFYGGILGFQEIPKPESLVPNGGLWFQAGDVELHIGVEPMDVTPSKRHPAFQIENVEDVRRYLEQNGIRTQDEKPIPGVTRFSFYDPFGNRIEFLERTPHELKQKIQERFGRNARSYVTSQVHAGGEDLNYLRKEVERTGGQRALDVATGGGHVAHTLAPFFDRVTAYDLTANMLESARDFIEGNGIQNVDFTQGDAESMPFQDESFDLAACRVAAHHFTDVRSFLHETHRVLTPGSRFLLIDNVSPEQDDWDRLYNEMEKRRDPGHHRALKKSEWLRLIELSGFEPVACRVFQKQLQFDDWCDRMQLSEQEKIDLTRFMLDAPRGFRDYFRMQTDPQDRIVAFQLPTLYVKAVRSS